MKNIVLIGLMGCGKTMVSKELAARSGRARFSTDELVEEREGKSVKDIVAGQGWDYFRAQEAMVVVELSQKQGIIIDCGGGVILNPNNFTELKKNGIIVFLDASPLVLSKRISGDPNRPLINVPDPLARLTQLHAERLPLYSQADLTIDANDASIEGPVVQILQRI